MLNSIKNFFRKRPIISTLIILFVIAPLIFDVLILITYNREEWAFHPYKSENGGYVSKYCGDSSIVFVPKYIDGKRVTRIDGWCFSNDLNPAYYDDGFDLDKVTTIIIPEGVEEIGKFAFEDCENLKYVYIPLSLKSISDIAFRGDCENVKIITLNPKIGKANDYK